MGTLSQSRPCGGDGRRDSGGRRRARAARPGQHHRRDRRSRVDPRPRPVAGPERGRDRPYPLRVRPRRLLRAAADDRLRRAVPHQRPGADRRSRVLHRRRREGVEMLLPPAGAGFRLAAAQARRCRRPLRRIAAEARLQRRLGDRAPRQPDRRGGAVCRRHDAARPSASASSSSPPIRPAWIGRSTRTCRWCRAAACAARRSRRPRPASIAATATPAAPRPAACTWSASTGSCASAASPFPPVRGATRRLYGAPYDEKRGSVTTALGADRAILAAGRSLASGE